jgi:nitrous oxidase accessory protein NosD
VSLLAVAMPATAASTLSVPADFASVQAAIDAAADGDTILVSPGEYHERIDFRSKDVTVASTDGAAATVLDGDSLGTVVVMNADPAESPTLRGFTVRNGRATFEDGYSGGGVKTSGGAAVIEDNVVTGNATCDSGGGIEARFSHAVIRRNRIEGNGQSLCSGGAGGGGVFIGGAGAVQLVDNVIAGNAHGSAGGGVSLFAAGSPTIARNVIQDNTGGGQGGGIWIVNNSDAQIEDNLIVGNSASAGGGVYWLVPSGSRGPALVNNTIVGNVAASGSALLADGFDAAARVANNVLVGAGSSVLHCGSLNDPNPPVIEFNDVVYTGDGARYGGLCADRTGTAGNVSVDPGFADGHRLSPSSPLVDAGTNVGVPAVDIDGEARTTDGNGDGVARTDIGADETAQVVDTAAPTLTVPAPITVDATGPLGAAVEFTVSAVDDHDPAPTVTCSRASGSVFPIGVTTVGCTARDAAGNTSAASFTVTVRSAAQQIAALRAEVAALPDTKLVRSLDANLADAAAALAAGQKSKACTKLAAFVSDVRRQPATKVPAATAARWIADATRIRAVAGC